MKDKEPEKNPIFSIGTTRLVFLVGASLLGFLVVCLGVGLFFDEVTADKMQIISGFLPLAFGTLGAMKVGDAYIEAKYVDEEEQKQNEVDQEQKEEDKKGEEEKKDDENS